MNKDKAIAQMFVSRAKVLEAEAWAKLQHGDTALLRQALEALERGETELRYAAITALRERLKENT